MSISVSPEAASWFKRELGLTDGDCVRLFPRYSSGGGLHPGFSLGIAVEPPGRPGLQASREGVVFYMEEQDLWYMEGYGLSIIYSPEEDDIEYRYEPEAGGEKVPEAAAGASANK
ncbi:HesB/YadR/YfhF family protein [Paenibacillus durus]|uniref:HesB/YadR/YfhF family protein n=1 Tax=Paenibacillus durus TaxID=44251 RepID=UPI0005A7683D|nr:HesB/YadR/YfhF family protein [Paenibacillus durus]